MRAWGSAESALPRWVPGEFGAIFHDSAGHPFATPRPMAGNKRFVYILRSTHETASYYVGLTSSVSARLASHEHGLKPMKQQAARRPSTIRRVSGADVETACQTLGRCGHRLARVRSKPT